MEHHQPNIKEVVIPAGEGNRYSFILFFLAIIFFGGPFMILYGGVPLFIAFRDFLTNYMLLIPALIGGVILHEVLHAGTWWWFCLGGMDAIDFGMKWQHLAPYVHCREPLAVKQYALGVAMPGIILGVLPALLGIYFFSGWWLWFGIFFTAGAAGDILSLYALAKHRGATLVQDHPNEIGFIIHS